MATRILFFAIASRLPIRINLLPPTLTLLFDHLHLTDDERKYEEIVTISS